MIKFTTLINFAKRVYFAFWWRGQGIKSAIMNKKHPNRLVFTFGGRNDTWPTVGRSLYRESFIFRDAILECNQILIKHGGSEILSYFEERADPLFYEDESKFTCITAIQIATTTVYNSIGIYPNTVMGVSMGEPAAAYAAGALTLEEALKISLSYMSLYKVERMNYAFVFLNMCFDEATKFCSKSPTWIEIIYEYSPTAVLITCDETDLDQLRLQFDEISMPFILADEKKFIPYHTSKIIQHRSFLFEFYRAIKPRPLRCDYYSPTLGKVIPKYSIIDPDYWWNLACVPVRFAFTLQTVINNGYRTFLQIGPPAISEKQFAEMSSNLKLNVFNSLESESTEMARHERVTRQILKIDFLESGLLENEISMLENFKHSFSLYNSNPTFAIEYLRHYGSVHFLPIHNSWLVIGYDDVEYALKNPALFSSSILKEYDPILLGADPQSHRSTRELLQPLFSSEAISKIAEFTQKTAEELLLTLSQKHSFDLVKDFSDPLSLYTLCHFFGLSSANAARMLAFTGQDYHNPQYWIRLQEFFHNEFNTCDLDESDSLWLKLRHSVRKNEFTLHNAASLLRIVWTAGMATTSALISSAIYVIITSPELSIKLKSDEKQVAKFIEECLRLHTPITIVQRITKENVEIDKHPLPTGSRLLLGLKYAMRDPNHYFNPGQFDIGRPAKRHVAFGAGIHQCIGMGLARAEARSAVQAILSEGFDVYEYNCDTPDYTIGSDLVVMSSLKLSKKIN